VSTLRVTNIKNGSSSSGGLEIDSSGHVQIDGQQMPAAGPLSNRNLIINGAMNVAQRATQVTSVTSPGYRTCDRYNVSLNNLGTWTVDQATDAPEGFTNSLKATCTTADASPAASSYALLLQNIEAQNLQHLKYGTSNAENLTLSFAQRYSPQVKVNSIAPALLEFNEHDDDNYKTKARNKSLLQTEGSFTEAINTVDWLMNSQYVTGRTIHLDGGRHLN